MPLSSGSVHVTLLCDVLLYTPARWYTVQGAALQAIRMALEAAVTAIRKHKSCISPAQSAFVLLLC